MSYIESLAEKLTRRFKDTIDACHVDFAEITLDVPKQNLTSVCIALRNEEDFKFEQLIDVCGIDYLEFGEAEWMTDQATGSGFERGVNRSEKVRVFDFDKPRFAVVYHLLSLTHNHRVRLKVFLDESDLIVDSVDKIWNSANWFEREAFDLYGILFEGHPDLRRILTDYGFIGHPFRKDFPISGNVEMRYDANEKRVIYEPVSIPPRVLVPKVIRDDSRYVEAEDKQQTQEGTSD